MTKKMTKATSVLMTLTAVLLSGFLLTACSGRPRESTDLDKGMKVDEMPSDQGKEAPADDQNKDRETPATAQKAEGEKKAAAMKKLINIFGFR